MLDDQQGFEPTTTQRVATIWHCSGEDAGRPLEEYIGPGLQLMEQTLEIEGNGIKLIVPRSSDAVMDYYIDAG